MKVKYNSFWSRVYKFSTGNSNEEMTDDFFQYWFVVIVGILFLPITLPTKLVQYLLPESKWNFSLRFFLGCVIWALLGCCGIIYHAANLTGYIVQLWTILVILFSGLFILYLTTVQFPKIGEKVIDWTYRIISLFGFLYSKVKIRPKLEFDKLDVYIIYNEINASLLQGKYEDICDKYMHIILPQNDCNLEEYPLSKYVVFKGTKYGDKIIKLEEYVG